MTIGLVRVMEMRSCQGDGDKMIGLVRANEMIGFVRVKGDKTIGLVRIMGIKFCRGNGDIAGLVGVKGIQ